MVQNIKVQIFHWWCDKWCENAGRFNASSQQSPLLCKHGLHLHHDENEGIKNWNTTMGISIHTLCESCCLHFLRFSAYLPVFDYCLCLSDPYSRQLSKVLKICCVYIYFLTGHGFQDSWIPDLYNTVHQSIIISVHIFFSLNFILLTFSKHQSHHISIPIDKSLETQHILTKERFYQISPPNYLHI